MQISFTGEKETHIKEETQTSVHMCFKKYDAFNSGPKGSSQKTQSNGYVNMNTQRCLKYQKISRVDQYFDDTDPDSPQ